MANNQNVLPIITKQQIEDYAKQTIREIILEEIKTIMSKIDIKSIIDKQLQPDNINRMLGNKIDAGTKKILDDLRWNIQRSIDENVKKEVIEKINDKPLPNVYLNISVKDVDLY